MAGVVSLTMTVMANGYQKVGKKSIHIDKGGTSAIESVGSIENVRHPC